MNFLIQERKNSIVNYFRILCLSILFASGVDTFRCSPGWTSPRVFNHRPRHWSMTDQCWPGWRHLTAGDPSCPLSARSFLPLLTSGWVMVRYPSPKRVNSQGKVSRQWRSCSAHQWPMFEKNWQEFRVSCRKFWVCENVSNPSSFQNTIYCFNKRKKKLNLSFVTKCIDQPAFKYKS